MTKTFAYLAFLLLLSCGNDDNGGIDVPEGTNLRVNYFTIDCVGVLEQQCLLVQEGSDIGSDTWDYFYDPIEGFDFELGFVYNLQVTKTKVENPPADGSLYTYKLVNIISRTEPICEFENPAEDLDWLRIEIQKREGNPSEDMKYCYITQAEYDANPVFVYMDCNPFINKVIPIFDCLGTQLNKDNNLFLDDLENAKIIWQPTDFVCDVGF
ncbi:MAG: DUF4377 domain-containing protein [Bacteroidota bacterium]